MTEETEQSSYESRPMARLGRATTQTHSSPLGG